MVIRIERCFFFYSGPCFPRGSNPDTRPQRTTSGAEGVLLGRLACDLGTVWGTGIIRAALMPLLPWTQT